MIAPPYSPDFVAALLPVIQNNEVTGPLKSTDLSDDVTQFLGMLLLVFMTSHSFSVCYCSVFTFGEYWKPNNSPSSVFVFGVKFDLKNQEIYFFIGFSLAVRDLQNILSRKHF